MTPDIARMKTHSRYPDLVAAWQAYMKRPQASWQASPEAMLQTVSVCSQMEAFLGEWPEPAVTKAILRRVRDEWPLPLTDFNHQLTLWHMPTLYWACKLSPMVLSELEIPLRWIESRMLEPQLIRKAPTAIYSTSPGSGLRDMTMLRDLLYGPQSAAEVAFCGFGKDPTQWGLPRLINDVIDEYGLLKVGPAAFNHWAWTFRPSLVWLTETQGYYRLLSAAEKDRWDLHYYLPCRMLCAGGKSVTIPGANDEYGMNPVLGPTDAWTRNSPMDLWARWHARRQEALTVRTLTVPEDKPGYVPPERPRPCTGNRDFGRVKMTEPKDGSSTTVLYVEDGPTIMGGHKIGRSLTVEVRR